MRAAPVPLSRYTITNVPSSAWATLGRPVAFETILRGVSQPFAPELVDVRRLMPSLLPQR
jgi:hypothetical protein